MALVPLAGLTLGAASLQGQADQPTPEEEATITYQGDFHLTPPRSAPPTVRAEDPEERGNLYNINMLVVVGDRREVYNLPNWDHYENEALYHPMSEADIESFRQRILKDLQDQGYIFATVSVYRPSLVQGFLKLRVHVGELGQVTVRGNRFRSAEQILRQMEWNTGQEFDYSTLFNRLYTLNANPSMQVQSQLRPRQEADGRRVIDADITVEERWPLSGALTISNDGSMETSEWRARLALQWYNPLKLDDTLGIEWFTSPREISDVNAFNASYVVPFQERYQLSLFGGYSKTDLENVLPQLDLIGKGYFTGASVHRNLWDSATASLDMAVGWMFMSTENRVLLGAFDDNGEPTDTQQERYKVDMSIPRISMSFANKDWDDLGGRNYITNTMMFHFAGSFGASGSGDFKNINRNSNGSFFINRFQYARFQKLWGQPDDTGSLSLFTRFDAQLASASLPTSMQKALGGQDTVRGYFEREVAGDQGVNFTAELRTPLLANFIRGLQRDEEFLRSNPDWWGVHRLQAVAFFDAGVVSYRDRLTDTDGGNLPGQLKSVSMYSIGAGLRMTFTRYSQLRLDYGYPLKTTPDRPKNGRLHFGGQLQF